jgi:hypothetical protein
MSSGSTLSFIFTMPPVAQSQVSRAATKIFEHQAYESVPQRLVLVAQVAKVLKTFHLKSIYYSIVHQCNRFIATSTTFVQINKLLIQITNTYSHTDAQRPTVKLNSFV